MNDKLGAAFTAVEVKKALFEMDGNKTPGPTVFMLFFFQKNWSIVGADVSLACLNVLNRGASMEGWNATSVCLIPKTKKSTKEMQF